MSADHPDSDDERLVLLRYSGDVSTKAKATRYQFVRRLLANLRDALVSEGIRPAISLTHDRMYATLPRSADLALLARIFGVQSVSAVERRTGIGLDEIVREGESLYRERVRGRHFAVRARRVGNRNATSLSARAVERDLGTALLPNAAGVRLGDPEVTVHVELHEGKTYFLGESLPARGGLPLGVEGRAVALVSGGFDSAVAAWHMQKRGVSLDYVFCNLGGATHQQGTLRVMKVVADRWSYGDHPRFHAVEFGPVAAELQQKTRTRYWQVLLKRLMLRAAESVARERRAVAIITGEALGQVSSQTLQNLAAISSATQLAILRPLVGMNKDEIIDEARRIGTHDLSKVVGEYCAMVPRKPATGASLADVLEEESKLDLSLIDQAVASREVFDLRSLDVEKLDLPELETERVPSAATVLDLRTKAEFESWHWPGAVRLDFSQAIAAYASFDRGVPYVLYCEIGLKSAHLAEMMRREGFDARHFRGGIRSMKKLVES